MSALTTCKPALGTAYLLIPAYMMNKNGIYISLRLIIDKSNGHQSEQW